jgi:hypothetical protein
VKELKNFNNSAERFALVIFFNLALLKSLASLKRNYKHSFRRKGVADSTYKNFVLYF